jgi:hypothetical protein
MKKKGNRRKMNKRRSESQRKQDVDGRIEERTDKEK